MREQFPSRDIGVVAYTSLLKGLCNHGRVYHALVAYDLMKQPMKLETAKQRRQQRAQDPSLPFQDKWVCTPNLRTANLNLAMANLVMASPEFKLKLFQQRQ